VAIEQHKGRDVAATTSHSEAVISALAMHVPGQFGRQVMTPFGVFLEAAPGKYVVGQTILAPGVDGCSPKLHAVVVAVGTRADRSGNWYLVQGVEDAEAFALIEEQALLPVWEPAVKFRSNVVGIGRREINPALYRS
jgi:hypothetical protein